MQCVDKALSVHYFEKVWRIQSLLEDVPGHLQATLVTRSLSDKGK